MSTFNFQSLEIEHKGLDSVVEGTPIGITMGKPEKEAVLKEKKLNAKI